MSRVTLATGQKPLRNTSPEIPRSADTKYNPAEGRFELRRLCPCAFCSGSGKALNGKKRCPACRGESRVLDLVASCHTPEAVGIALVTLGREGEFQDCPFGLLDREGEKGLKWLVSPWPASPRTISDAGKMLRATQLKGERP